jgi:hypothetical protein
MIDMKKPFFFLMIIQWCVNPSVFAQSGGDIKNGEVAPNFTAKDQKWKYYLAQPV